MVGVTLRYGTPSLPVPTRGEDMGTELRLLVVDDHKIVRDGLRSLIDREPDMQLIGQADNGRDAVRLAQELSPDVVIMDVSMADMNGVEATRQIVNENPAIKVIALSMHSDKQYVSRMLSAHAAGYLLKDCAFDELATAVRAVTQGNLYLSPGVTSVVIGDYVERLSSNGSPARSALSAREFEVLQLVAEGYGTRVIAAKLHISVKTVESHRRHIMEKLDIHTVAELTKYAIRTGLTALED